MIESIVKKDSKIISKVKCLEQIEELGRKNLSIMALIKEFSAIKEIEEWDLSPIPILCESYVYVNRIIELLNKLYNKFYEKNEIRITPEESLIYVSYQAGLASFGQELRHFYSINLQPEKNIQ